MTYDYFLELSRRPGRDPHDSDAVSVKYHHLAATERKDEADKLRKEWSDARLQRQGIDIADVTLWSQIAVPHVNFAVFPPYSLLVQFPFRLTKPYLSKDERDFYVVDNPIRRDRVFRLPYVAPSSWKGSLRAALWKLEYNGSHPAIWRLFGNEKETEEDFRAGRLRFFPTFFSQHSLEIINPHDRERKVGINPILFESVPAGALGVFSLLYVPFDRIGQNEAETRREVAEDLRLVIDGMHAMLCIHGFGAKTSSGFGAIVESFPNARDRKRYNLPDGRALLKAVLSEPAEMRDFRQAYGPLNEFSPDEWRNLLLGDEFQAYQAAQAAHESHQRNVQTRQVSCEVDSLTEVIDTLRTWASALPSEEGQDDED